MLKRVLAGALGALSAANGAIMLSAGPHWYETTPGVADTGPFNPHFVADVGAAYAVAGSALLARAVRPQYWPAAVAGAAFLSRTPSFTSPALSAGGLITPVLSGRLSSFPPRCRSGRLFRQKEKLMRRWIARKAINRFGAQFDYDVGYMRWLLSVSPSAFFKFLAVTKLSRHAEAAPQTALFAARIVGAMTEDCGPCVQLVVDMARAARVPDGDIDAILRRDERAMSDEAALAFRFADAVARRENADERREAVRSRWGDRGVVDLTFALQASRLYPMVKAGLGYARECVRVKIGGKPVDVARAA